MKPSHKNEDQNKQAPQKGFRITGAPWDATNTEDFPAIGGGANGATTPNGSGFASAWGKK